MKIIEDTIELQQILSNLRKIKRKIGLIPTMGSLHKGHLSLIRESKKLNCYSVVSIFINPTQFNESKDYLNYPNNIKNDIDVLNEIKCDLLYIPQIADLYTNKVESKKTIFNYREILCDKYRPGHFDGVTTIVEKLFNLIMPNISFFGEKDFQQLKIIEKLIKLKKLPIKIHRCPSIRKKNGMSYSSRYLNFNSKQDKIFNNIAYKIKQDLILLKNKIDFNILINLKKEILNLGAKKIDYLEIREEKELLTSKKNKNSRLFLSFYIDDIRIIDNFILY